MQKERCQIIKYRSEFKSRLIKLQAHLWGRDEATRAAYLDWKYHGNPYAEDTHIYIALCNKQLIGMVGAYGAKWQIGDTGQTFPGLCFADLIIHPRHRHRNLFPKLIAFSLNDLANTSYEYVFDLSAAPHVALNLLMQGWRSIFIQTAYRRIDDGSKSGLLVDNDKNVSRFPDVYLKILGHLEKLPFLASTYRWLGRCKDGLVRPHSSEPPPVFVNFDRNAERHKINPNVTLSKTARPRAMAELSQRIGHDGRIRHVKDEQYLNWRFQNPLSEYRFLFWDNGRLDGYLVLHMKVYPPGNDEMAYIVDWDAVNGWVWNDLLQAAIDWGDFNYTSIWSAALSEDVKVLLKKNGFAFIDKTGITTRDVQGENILVKSVNIKKQRPHWILGGRDLLNPANWDLRTICSDNF